MHYSPGTTVEVCCGVSSAGGLDVELREDLESTPELVRSILYSICSVPNVK